jgi:aminocarboxymuconate-semialdehyde decarboxylase
MMDKDIFKERERSLYDSVVFTPEALRHLAAETGPNQIIMGTDCPCPRTKRSVDHILAAPGLSDADKVGMLGATARELLPIPG